MGSWWVPCVFPSKMVGSWWAPCVFPSKMGSARMKFKWFFCRDIWVSHCYILGQPGRSQIQCHLPCTKILTQSGTSTELPNYCSRMLIEPSNVKAKFSASDLNSYEQTLVCYRVYHDAKLQGLPEQKTLTQSRAIEQMSFKSWLSSRWHVTLQHSLPPSMTFHMSHMPE